MLTLRSLSQISRPLRRVGQRADGLIAVAKRMVNLNFEAPIDEKGHIENASLAI